MALPKENKTRSFNRNVTREALLAAEQEGWEMGEEESAKEAASGGQAMEAREP